MTHEKKEHKIERKYTEVRESSVHHKGVFAAEDIPKGTIIMEYGGIIINKEEADMVMGISAERNRQNPETHAGTYIFELDTDRFLDGDIPDNDAKYANHSCEPNCDIEIGHSSVWLIALKDIKKGDEITFNYGFEIADYTEHDLKYHKCRCGSKKCVGYILSEDDWPRINELLEKEKELIKNE